MGNDEYVTRLRAAIKQGNEKEIKAIKEQNANDLRKKYLSMRRNENFVNVCRATPNWNGCDYCDKFGGSGLECWKQDGKHDCRYCEQVKKQQLSMEEKAARFVNMYVTEMEHDGANDSYIIDTLLECFSVDDLIRFGLANFIKNYMEG